MTTDNLVRFFVQETRWGGQLNKLQCTSDYPFRSPGYEDLDEALAVAAKRAEAEQDDRFFIGVRVIKRETTVTETVVG